MFDLQRPMTETDIAYRELEMISSISENALENFEREVNIAHDIFWKGRVSPVIKARLAGTELLQMFTNAGKAQALIKSVNPDYEQRGIPEGWEVEWQEDGSGIVKKIPLQTV